MNTQILHKHDIPPVGKPLTYWIFGSMWGIGYILLLIFVPDTRPGIMEVVLGAALSIPAGFLLSKALIWYMKQLAPVIADKPWLKWVSIAAYPLPPFNSSILYRLAMGVIILGGFLLLGFLIDGMHKLFPEIGWPWARSETFESLAPAMIIYFLTVYGIISRSAISWYRSLPD